MEAQKRKTFIHEENIKSIVHDPMPTQMPSERILCKDRIRHVSFFGTTSICATQHAQKTKYVARMHMKALRFYTTGQVEIKKALEHQAILLHMRNVLAQARVSEPEVWEDSGRICCMCTAIMKEYGTSEKEMGLSVFVHMRAVQWLGSRCSIISPVMSLTEAVALHSRLLRARRTSWEALRAEWIRILCQKKRFSTGTAEAMVEKIRQNGLKERFTQTVRKVERAF